MSARTATLAEAAAELGVGEQTLRDHMVADGSAIELGTDRLRLVRVGRRVLVPRVELERLLGS
jgi:predicted transcriptional regulator